VPAPSDPRPADGEQDTPMTGTYIAVLVVEAVIVALLWVLGQVY
jgi:hypothetical protein